MAKKRRDTPEWQWEQALIDAYYDARWREVFDALHTQLHDWESGKLAHDEMSDALHAAHKGSQEVYTFFGDRNRDHLILFIALDEAWFTPWLSAHPAPQGIDLSRLQRGYGGPFSETAAPEQEEARG